MPVSRIQKIMFDSVFDKLQNHDQRDFSWFCFKVANLEHIKIKN